MKDRRNSTMYLLRIMWSHFIYLAVLSNLGFGYALKCIISWYDYRCQGLLNRLRTMWYLVGIHFLWHTLACITHHSHFNRIRMLMALWWQWWVSKQQQKTSISEMTETKRTGLTMDIVLPSIWSDINMIEAC